MKVLKKTAFTAAHISKDGGRDNLSTAKPQAIKLKAVTAAERQLLRISSYQYILPWTNIRIFIPLHS